MSGRKPFVLIHHKEDEAWFVLDGHVTFYVGDAVLEAGAGSFVFAPSGIAHTFTVDVEPTRSGVRLTRGVRTLRRGIGQPRDEHEPPAGLGVPGPDVLGPVAQRYGIEVVGPPRRASH
jgi:hypothetical protein